MATFMRVSVVYEIILYDKNSSHKCFIYLWLVQFTVLFCFVTVFFIFTLFIAYCIFYSEKRKAPLLRLHTKDNIGWC